jgi:hypothetical protein
MNVRVVEKDGVVDAGCQHRLHDFPGAGRTARVQQYLLLASRRNEIRPCGLGHGIHGIRLSDS